MLYQVWESPPIPYAAWPYGYEGYEYTDCFVDASTGWESDFCETLNCRSGNVWNVLVQREDSPGSHSDVYVYGIFATRYWPSWKIFVAAFDGATGDYMWIDKETWGGYLTATSLIDGYFTDLDGRLWADHTYGYTYRIENFTEEDTTNNFAGAPGMPNFLERDILLNYDHWKFSDGSPLDHRYRKMLAILSGQNVALMTWRGRTQNVPYPMPDRCVMIHNYSTGNLEGYVEVPAYPVKAVVVDSSTIYTFCAGGIIAVIDYQLHQLRGVLHLGPEYTFSPHTRWIGAALDPVYRRIYICNPTPDTAIGDSTTVVKGYQPKEVPVGLTKPIPKQIAREGRTVPVFARLYGHGGHGIPGVRVAAEITSGGNNTISPSVAISDHNGYVYYNWGCVDDGTDIDTITLTASYDEHDPGMTPGSSPPVTISAPTGIDNELYFEPGWWGWSPYSSSPPATKWGAYVGGYTDDPIPIRGIVQEYAWTDFETAPATFDWSKLDADITYLSNLGLKLAIFIRLKSPDDSTVWVPSDITGETAPEPYNLYAISEQAACNGMHGVIHLASTQGGGFYPILWDTDIHNRYNTFLLSLNSHVAAEGTVVGFFPMDDEVLSYTDVRDSRTGADYDTARDKRREFLNLMNGYTTKPVWDVLFYNNDAGRSWAVQNDINYCMGYWSLDDTTPWLVSYSTVSHYRTVATGFRIRNEDWGEDNCNAVDATPYEWVFGGPDMDAEGCDKKHVLQHSAFWFGFFDLVEPQWSLADEGIEATCANYELRLPDQYRGG